MSPTFPSMLKLVDIFRVYKKDSRYEKSNCRSVSVLPNLSKSLKINYMTKSPLFLKLFSLNIKLVSGKASNHKVVW